MKSPNLSGPACQTPMRMAMAWSRRTKSARWLAIEIAEPQETAEDRMRNGSRRKKSRQKKEPDDRREAGLRPDRAVNGALIADRVLVPVPVLVADRVLVLIADRVPVPVAVLVADRVPVLIADRVADPRPVVLLAAPRRLTRRTMRKTHPDELVLILDHRRGPDDRNGVSAVVVRVPAVSAVVANAPVVSAVASVPQLPGVRPGPCNVRAVGRAGMDHLGRCSDQVRDPVVDPVCMDHLGRCSDQVRDPVCMDRVLKVVEETDGSVVARIQAHRSQDAGRGCADQTFKVDRRLAARDLDR